MRTDDNEVNRTRTAVPQGSAEGLPRPDRVTSVIQHRVHVDAPAQYETWLQEITPAAQHFPGHRGVNSIRPSAGADVYTIVLHFDPLRLHATRSYHSRLRIMPETSKPIKTHVMP